MNKKTVWIHMWTAVLLLATTAVVRAQEQPQKPEELTLRRAVQLATQNSRELALARIQLTIAENQAGVVRSSFRPNFFTGSGAAYNNGFPVTPGGSGPSIFGLSYTQSIFNLPLRGQLKADEARTREQQVSLETTRDAVILRAASDYLELQKVRHELELLRMERKSSQQILDATRERFAAGLELEMEVTKGELQGAKIEQRAAELEGRDEVLTEDLRRLTGLPTDQSITLADDQLPSGAEQPAEQWVAEAIDYSPDIRAAEFEQRAREKELAAQKGSYWPTLSLIGQYSVFAKYNNYFEFYKKFVRNNVTVGLQVSIPIFSSTTRANVTLAQSRLTEAQLELSTKRRDVDAQVHQQLRDSRQRDAAREVQRLELKLAQENLAVVQAKFDQDRATLQELEQARVDENEKWQAFLDADFARQQAQLALYRSTGQLAKLLQ